MIATLRASAVQPNDNASNRRIYMKLNAAPILCIAILFNISFHILNAAETGVISVSQADESATPIPTPTPSRSPEPQAKPTIQGYATEPSFADYLNDGLSSRDVDCDGVENAKDNCVLVYNPSQENSDGDQDGDVCDRDNKKFKKKDLRCDTDHDGVFDEKDNCPAVCNPDQKDNNKDGIGDACDSRKTKLATVKTCKSSKSTDLVSRPMY